MLQSMQQNEMNVRSCDMKSFSYLDLNERGAIRRVEYVGIEGARKYASVYLPYGYDADRERRYDILYLMHGGGGNPDAWLDSCPVKNMLDRSFASGEARPMIVVFPTFYAHGARRLTGTVDEAFEHGSVLSFQKEELTQRLLPAVEGAVRGYAEGTDPASLKRARAHRAFGGFSMGSVNTWYAFSLHPDYFSAFLPLSGDSWEACVMGGAKQPEKTAEILRGALLSKGYGPEDFRIFAATGTEDIAWPSLTPQIEAMKKKTDMFRFSEDYGEGNLHYLVADGLAHNYDAVCTYVYNLLPHLFRE